MTPQEIFKSNANEKSKEEMSIFGVGPKIFITLCPFLIFFVIINIIFFPSFQIPIDYSWMIILGSIFFIVGVFMFIHSERILRKSFKASELRTNDVFGYVRNPLYASWEIGIIPGTICFSNSWIFFPILLIYYIIVRIYVREEENYLLKKFGEKYAHYKRNVNFFFPKLKKIQTKIMITRIMISF